MLVLLTTLVNIIFAGVDLRLDWGFIHYRKRDAVARLGVGFLFDICENASEQSERDIISHLPREEFAGTNGWAGEVADI